MTCAGERESSLTPTTRGPRNSWRQGRNRLTRDSVRDATKEEVHQLKRENGELKQLVADLSLEVYRFKKTSIPMPQGAGGISG